MTADNIANLLTETDSTSSETIASVYTRILRTQLPISDFRALCNRQDLLQRMIEFVRISPSPETTTEETFKVMTEHLVKLTMASQAIVLLYDGVPREWRSGGDSCNSAFTLKPTLAVKLAQQLMLLNQRLEQPQVLIEQLIVDSRPYGILLVPVIAGGMITGMVMLVKDQAGTDFDVQDFSSCLACGTICSQIIGSDVLARELNRQMARGEKLLEEINRAQSSERQRIGYELHDGIAQWLTGAAMELDSCRIRLDQGKLKELYASLENAQETLRSCIKELRRSISNLRPVLITELGLLGAIQKMATSFETDSFKCTLSVKDQLPDFTKAEENALYWIVQEALNNIRKHASATAAEIIFKNGSGCFEITILDNGKGYEQNALNASILLNNKLGLEGMNERAKLFGWELLITSSVGAGTHIMLKLINHGK
jgi:signal transduction histidine kinase